DDVIFSFNILRAEGLPIFKTYYADVEKVEAVGTDQVVFTLKNNKNRELPIILGQVPVFSKKYYTTVKFSETSLTPPPSAGPYEIVEVKPGHSITYRRVKNWWGENLPSQKGLHNFDSMRSIYYRDSNAIFEAFKSGQTHWRFENSAKLWHTGYTFDAVTSGKVKKEQIKHAMSPGSQGLFFNTRREVFKNKNVRKALTLLYNFEWANKNIFYTTYERNLTFFPNSIFEAKGDATPEELKVMKDVGVDVAATPDYTKTFTLPVYSDEAKTRTISEEALSILKAEGWTIKNQKLQNAKGEQLTFEIMIYDKSIERVISQYVETLKGIGINAKIRFVDVAAYQERLDATDFDMIFAILPVSTSPGNELRNYYTSISMNQRGTYNYYGIHDPAVDTLVEHVINAKDFETLTLHMRVLDRLLINNYYMIPAWHSNKVNIAYWSHVTHPDVTPKYNPVSIATWWSKEVAKTSDANSPDVSVETSLWQRLYDWIMHLIGVGKS
ncbi:MAG: extracellular solute-binding protein, partial [Alphaproteobacteria bacterium]|nr:extracellular solute-binding protein [Alphaproteobacteria bacterium]